MAKTILTIKEASDTRDFIIKVLARKKILKGERLQEDICTE